MESGRGCVKEQFLRRKANGNAEFAFDLHNERLAVAEGERSWVKSRNELQRNEPSGKLSPVVHEELKGCLKLISAGLCPIYTKIEN